jgi:DNA-binding XRE family transcriptional regulator
MWTYSTAKQKEFREKTLHNIADFAKKAGLAPATIGNIEQGNSPSVETYLSIINAFNLTPGIFFEERITFRNDIDIVSLPGAPSVA